MPPRTTEPDLNAPPLEWTPRSSLAPPERVVHIASEAHAREVLANSRDSPVAMLGGGFSRARILRADSGLLLDVTGMAGLVRLDASTATFGAGTRLETVHDLLRSIGRRMDCSPGVIAAQTLAGAVGTGTHGQGLRQSTLGDALEAVRFVDGTGAVRVLRHSDPEFGALRLHLGRFGVLTELTIRTVPWSAYTCEKLAVTEAELAVGFPRWNEQYPFCKAWWFPDTGMAHVWRVRDASAAEQERLRRNDNRPVPLTGADHHLNAAVRATMAAMRRQLHSTDPRRDHFLTVTRFMDFHDVTGDLYDLLCKGIPVQQVNLEVALPLERFHRVQRVLREWFDERHPELHYPVILRATGPSKAWLSPAYGGSACHFGFVVYRATDGSIPGAAMRSVREAEELLAAEGGRPHWGKHFTPRLYDFPRLFPRWDDFLDAAGDADPGGRFGNAFLRGLLWRRVAG
ncbi:hypothetical protein UK23_31060 [Lentzea aerocolonigenes]|uniref:FAD-binding PCMH-type domain-containing protein n=1 Tax=Lentzea aerocolonigenes TaxID=68170 RepID=A0A0F0GRI7_LENAE|nr:hypothetical protein UK23_31060 [Lentzea aerocolonigenes]